MTDYKKPEPVSYEYDIQKQNTIELAKVAQDVMTYGYGFSYLTKTGEVRHVPLGVARTT